MHLNSQKRLPWWLKPVSGLDLWIMKIPWRSEWLPTSVFLPGEFHGHRSLVGYGFSSSHVWMWELDREECWVLKSWCLWIVVLEKSLESPLDCKEIKLVNPRRNQPWIVTGRTDAEAEAPVVWTPDVKSRLTGEDPDAGKDWRQKDKGKAEYEMAGWHHWLNGHESEQTPGESEGQERLAYCSPWDHKESETIQQLNSISKFTGDILLIQAALGE